MGLEYALTLGAAEEGLRKVYGGEGSDGEGGGNLRRRRETEVIIGSVDIALVGTSGVLTGETLVISIHFSATAPTATALKSTSISRRAPSPLLTSAGSTVSPNSCVTVTFSCGGDFFATAFPGEHFTVTWGYFPIPVSCMDLVLQCSFSP